MTLTELLDLADLAQDAVRRATSTWVHGMPGRVGATRESLGNLMREASRVLRRMGERAEAGRKLAEACRRFRDEFSDTDGNPSRLGCLKMDTALAEWDALEAKP